MVTPTSYHAHNLFTLTMESRYGGNWRYDLTGAQIKEIAAEVASGFGGEMISQGEGSTAAPNVWRFPDSSIVGTGVFGLSVDEANLDQGPQQAAQ